MHCEASDGSWKCWEEVAVSCKFRGKYLEVCPLGVIHVFFPGSENHYTFPKVRRERAIKWREREGISENSWKFAIPSNCYDCVTV